jgi:hypothetical protein
LKFTESELAEFAWEMPLSFLVRNREDVRIIEKNGVQFLTDSIPNPIIAGCDGLFERGQATSSPVAAANAIPNVQPGGSASTIPLHTVNTNPQGLDRSTVSDRPTKRQKTRRDVAGELCHQEASLHLLADAAVREQSDIGDLSSRDVENAASRPQPEITLSDGSCLPIHFLVGQGAGMEEMGIGTGAQEAPRVSMPYGRHDTTELDEAAEMHSPQRLESLDHFMDQVLDFPEDSD